MARVAGVVNVEVSRAALALAHTRAHTHMLRDGFSYTLLPALQKASGTCIIRKRLVCWSLGSTT